MARCKDTAHPVPQTQEEAIALLRDYIDLDRRILTLRLSAGKEIDRIKASRDQAIALLQEDQAGWFAALKAWWEAGGKKTAGRGRSAELAGAKIGIRLTPPKVKFQRGTKVDAVLAWLAGLRWKRAAEFRRTKVELDKPAIIKGVQADEHVRAMFADAGVTVVQDDEFFIDSGLDEEAVQKELAA